MDSAARIERSLGVELATCRDAGGPSKLADAMEYAVFPGGARVRPMLCLQVAQACGDQDGRMALAAATSLELLHCASLVHDDLPCFDDANLRRGKPSVHRAYGEPIAVLAGDALILLAVSTLVRAAPAAPEKLGPMLTVVTGATGMPHGIIAGQAWESEAKVDLDVYHRSKTAALFVAACSAGAIAAGVAPKPWSRLGEAVGQAYQLMDDLSDCVGTLDVGGKPVGQDVRLGRPNALQSFSPEDVRARIDGLMQKAIEAVPSSASPGKIERLLQGLAGRFSSSLERVSAA